MKVAAGLLQKNVTTVYCCREQPCAANSVVPGYKACTLGSLLAGSIGSRFASAGPRPPWTVFGIGVLIYTAAAAAAAAAAELHGPDVAACGAF